MVSKTLVSLRSLFSVQIKWTVVLNWQTNLFWSKLVTKAMLTSPFVSLLNNLWSYLRQTGKVLYWPLGSKSYCDKCILVAWWSRSYIQHHISVFRPITSVLRTLEVSEQIDYSTYFCPIRSNYPILNNYFYLMAIQHENCRIGSRSITTDCVSFCTFDGAV